ncbi:hypothetical protein [uncultured Tenacibaculum sp.]|uniref:hypothetical protein n=2 Tax=uncultured Tenacibaculum sp. TaxID=174713 RepID=UPI0026190D7A|nr:hypothetical protein [uncultured Tenacibaculum sp.]
MRLKSLKKNSFILLICMLLTSVQVISQNTDEINAMAKKMFVDMNNRDYDAILDMCHPKAFEFASRDQLKTVFKSAFEGNEEFSLDVPKVIPDYKISKLYKEEGLEYVFVTYDMTMKMTFHKEEFDEEGKEMMKNIMKMQEMDVEFTSNKSMSVNMKDRITILLKGKGTDNKWVMVNYDANSPLVYNVLSANVLETAKTFKQDLMLERKKESQN